MKYGMQHYSISNDVKVENDFLESLEYKLRFERDLSGLNEMTSALDSYVETFKNLVIIKNTYTGIKQESDSSLLKEVDNQINSALSRVCGSLYTTRFSVSTCFKSKQEEDNFKMSLSRKMEGLGEILEGIWNFIMNIIKGIFNAIGSIFKGISNLFTGGSSSSSGGGGGGSGGSGGSSSGKGSKDISEEAEKKMTRLCEQWNKTLEDLKEDSEFFKNNGEELEEDEKLREKLIARVARRSEKLINIYGDILNFNINNKKIFDHNDKESKQAAISILKEFFKDPEKAAKEVEYIMEARGKDDMIIKHFSNFMKEAREADANKVCDILLKVIGSNTTKANNTNVEKVIDILHDVRQYIVDNDLISIINLSDHHRSQLEQINDTMETIGGKLVDEIEKLIDVDKEAFNTPDKTFAEEAKRYLGIISMQRSTGLFGSMPSCYYYIEKVEDNKPFATKMKVKGRLYYLTAECKLVEEKDMQAEMKNISKSTLDNVVDFINEFRTDTDNIVKETKDFTEEFSDVLYRFSDKLHGIKDDALEKSRDFKDNPDASKYLYDASVALANLSKLFAKASSDSIKMIHTMAKAYNRSFAFLSKVEVVARELDKLGVDGRELGGVDLENIGKDVRRILG